MEIQFLLKKIRNVKERDWKTEEIPQEWEECIICSMFKKGVQLDCSNYRRIRLLNTAYKIFSDLFYE
jgi:hypothetical protein